MNEYTFEDFQADCKLGNDEAKERIFQFIFPTILDEVHAFNSQFKIPWDADELIRLVLGGLSARLSTLGELENEEQLARFLAELVHSRGTGYVKREQFPERFISSEMIVGVTSKSVVGSDDQYSIPAWILAAVQGRSNDEKEELRSSLMTPEASESLDASLYISPESGYRRKEKLISTIAGLARKRELELRPRWEFRRETRQQIQRELVITLGIPFAEWDLQTETQFLEVVRHILGVDHIGIANVREGSTIVHLSLPMDQAVRLVAAIQQGELSEFNVKDVAVYRSTAESISVFLSSTSHDLLPYRAAARRVIRDLGFVCVCMETFGANPSTPIALCIAEVTMSNLFVGVLGHVYGSCPPRRKTSFTEIEYQTALENNIPTLMFVAPDDFPVRADLIEKDETRKKQKKFRNDVKSKHVCESDFVSPDSFADTVSTALEKWADQQSVLLAKPGTRGSYY